ncbi:MAG: SDR family NAD(P)-dependent oxidoreductase [Gammaproteobacteria bacterium]
MSLKNKVAVVTGGSRDIGRAIAVKLASEGANVVVNYCHNKQQGEETIAEIEKVGGKGVLAPGDMTKSDDVASVVKTTCDAFGGKINILVNNVGGLVARKPLADMDLEFLEGVMRLNLSSTFLTMHHAVPAMSDGGAVVNLSSLAGRDGGGGGASAYSAAKGAVMTFTRAMAKELGPSGIRVNCVCPGMISTSFHDEFTPDAVRAKVAGSTPLGREGRATEVADLVTYLASDASSFVTGASLDINGGLYFS